MKTNEDIKRFLHYNPENGLFYRNQNRGPHKSGSQAGSIRQDGYVRIQIFDKQYLGHRLAWLLFYGEEPSLEIDHINGDRSDNRIKNLRLVSCAQNNQNKAISKSNKSGIPGVWFDSRKKMWRAGIKTNKKFLHIGYFDSIEKATAARQDSAKKHHPFYARS